MSSLHDPFDIMDNKSNVVPILPKAKLDEMVAKAISHPQQAPARKWVSAPATRWIGSVAIAACLLLLITPKQPLQPALSTEPVMVGQIEDGDYMYADDDGSDFDDMIVLATLENE